MPDDKLARPNPERLSWSADSAAVRWREQPSGRGRATRCAAGRAEDDHIVPNRHSASAEAAALRWSERHGDED